MLNTLTVLRVCPESHAYMPKVAPEQVASFNDGGARNLSFYPPPVYRHRRVKPSSLHMQHVQRRIVVVVAMSRVMVCMVMGWRSVLHARSTEL